VLEYAVAMGVLDANPAFRIRNTRAAGERREMRPFETWEQVNSVAAEMDPRFAAIPVVLVGTGLRPEELFALERRDVDLDAGVLTVERVYTQRVLKEPKKSSRQRRRVPLRARVVDALRSLPPRLDTPFSSPLPAAAISTSRSFVIASGRRRSAQPGSNAAECTTVGTHSRLGRSPAAFSSSTWRALWERRSR
jgi:integrase